MRNRSQKTAETLLLDHTKNKEKTCKPPGQTQEKGVWNAQQVLCPSHCETVAGKMPKRRCWNPLERRKYMPKPCETAARKLPKRCFWNLRKMPKRCIWNLLKTKKRLPQARQTFAQRKTWKPASHQTKLKTRCLGRACEKAEPQQVLCPSHCETAAGKMPKRRCWNPLRRKK